MSSPPPVSLGKPSLRHRLESYYSLIAPDAIVDKDKWKKNFEIIYNKYGSTVEGENKLSAKLAKKYGTQVRLLVAPPHRSMQRQLQKDYTSGNAIISAGSKRDESYYEADESQRGSNVLDFTSARFDARYALNAPKGIVMEANPTIFSGPTSQNTKLDNISKFRALLPECDPQRLDPASMHTNTSSSVSKKNIANPSAGENIQKKAPMFLSMASQYESKNSGPLSLLYSIVANRERARVMVRYVDCIRGTLTGYLIAFDKHFNMILKDVDEVYSGRVTRNSGAVEVARGGGDLSAMATSGSNTSVDNKDAYHASAPSKAKLEAQRRRCYPSDGSGGPGPAVKQRYFHQLLVRGDNVVMVWRAEAERSIHPSTNKSPHCSVYTNADTEASIGKGQTKNDVGTPGSLYYALQRWENQSGRQRRIHR